MPLLATTAARRCWRRSIAGTSSSSRSTTAGAGIATTSSSPTCCARTCCDEQPDRVLELHRRASDWYEQNGDRSEAIRHALAGEDVERAADLIELALPAMRQSQQEATVLGWLRALPDEVIGRRPVLSVAYAWVLIASGELEDVERRLQRRRALARGGRRCAR